MLHQHNFLQKLNILTSFRTKLPTELFRNQVELFNQIYDTGLDIVPTYTGV